MIRVGNGVTHRIDVSGCIRSGMPECGNIVSYDIGYGRQIFTGCSREVHNRRNTGHHVVCRPAGHCHVLESLACFRRGEFRLGAHFLRLGGQRIQIFSACSGDRGYLGHLGLETGTGIIDAFGYALDPVHRLRQQIARKGSECCACDGRDFRHSGIKSAGIDFGVK